MSALRRRSAERRIFDHSGAVPLLRWRDRIADTSSALLNIAGFGARLTAPADLPRGNGHPVLVIPGLFNFGPTPACWHIAERRLAAMADRSGQRASLVGHSLGGVMARALAYEHPELVRRVITVCSPFRLPTAMRFEPLYRLLSHARIEPEILLSRMAEPPPVPTTAIYSPHDGIVAWQSCIDELAPDRENIGIDGAHSTMMSNPETVRVIAERLAIS
jgi:alpha/beta hydrolase fold